MAGETVTELIVNLKEEIQKYAATKNHTHLDLKNDIDRITNSLSNYFSKDALLAYLRANYYNQTDSNNRYAPKNHASNDTTYGAASSTKYGHTKVASSLTENEANPVQGKAIVSYITNALKNVKSDTFAHPTQTTTKINYLFSPGYYIYVGNADTFSCMPDSIQYKNGLIRVEKQSNHVIQHVYSTSYSTSAKKYKIDGREFTRHGYTSTKNGKTVGNWHPWHVAHLPWRKRNDLLIKAGTNVQGTFDLYESTAGYTFRWIQAGDNKQYNLHVPQYSYATVYTFKQLPIIGPHVFGNLIGHMDIKITNSDFKIRSINRNGEHIIGMDETYFVPRTN